jgi:hypothetical protein
VARELRQVAERLVDLAAREGRAEGGELGALQTTLWALDAAQAAAVELTSHVQRRGSAERSAGLSLEHLLALETRLTGPDRRMLASAAETLRTMPHLTPRSRPAGSAGPRSARSSARPAGCPSRPGPSSTTGSGSCATSPSATPTGCSTKSVPPWQRCAREGQQGHRARHRTPLPGTPTPAGRLRRHRLLRARRRRLRHRRRRPRGRHARTLGRPERRHHRRRRPRRRRRRRAETADGDPAFCDHVPHRVRARQRADALVLLAESFWPAPVATVSPVGHGPGS